MKQAENANPKFVGLSSNLYVSSSTNGAKNIKIIKPKKPERFENMSKFLAA
jgi:hypothetical protein